MKRNSTSSFGALHPIFFMMLVYVISFVLAFFVCRIVHKSLYASDTPFQPEPAATDAVTALK